MATSFKLLVTSPVTTSGSKKDWVFTDDAGVPTRVSQIDCELKRDHKRISTLTVKITDPAWVSRPRDALFNALPDPAWQDVPVKLWLAPPSAPRSPTVLVFDGKLTSLQPAFPAPTLLTLVATDRSIDLRREGRLRTFKNKTSVQLAQAIANEYGYTVQADTGDVVPKQRAIDIGFGGSVGGAKLSDWEHLVRALAGDGLLAHMEGSTLVIKRTQDVLYPYTFRHGDPRVISFVPMIEHVHGPGDGGSTKTVAAFDRNGNVATVAAAVSGTVRTHRGPVEGQPTGSSGAHAEIVPVGWTNAATQLAKRKDTATLTLVMSPDIKLVHQVGVQGWGVKCDGPWFVETVKHTFASAGAVMQTVLTLKRAGQTGPGASKPVTLDQNKNRV